VTIKVYSTPTCMWCTRVKEYLNEKGVAYETVDISADRAAAIELVKTTRQMAVPVIMSGDEFVVGFDTAGIDRLIAKERG